MRTGRVAFIAAAAAILLMVAGCRLYNLERKLPPKYSDFLSKVQYIISGEERKIFLELPDTEKDDFIEKFWERRDPDSSTEVNEYKVEYENRVNRAATLFQGEGRPGWLTDRGRIFILFGPPGERLTYPLDASGYCREVWYYGSFPVIFIDQYCSGYYTLTAINLEHLQELNIAQGYFQNVTHPEERLFDYGLSAETVGMDESSYEGKIKITIPYSSIWFGLKEGRLETSFAATAKAYEEKGKPLIWERSEIFPLSMDEEELKANRNKIFVIEIPMRLNFEEAGLTGGVILLEVAVKNMTEGVELKKTLKLQLRS